MWLKFIFFCLFHFAIMIVGSWYWNL